MPKAFWPRTVCCAANIPMAILVIETVLTAAPARAQTYDPAYPVCLQIYQGWNDYYFECAYTSLAQCNASASGRAAQSSTRITRVQKRRRGDETGGIAASTKAYDHLTPQRAHVPHCGCVPRSCGSGASLFCRNGSEFRA